MKVARLCTHDVVTVTADTLLQHVAERMRAQHVGDVVVLDADGSSRPVGILTDRDLVLAVMALDLDPQTFIVSDILGGDLLCLEECEEIDEALRQMRQRGVRRVPVVDGHGLLRGLLSLDHVIDYVAGLVEQVAALVQAQRHHESQQRP